MDGGIDSGWDVGGWGALQTFLPGCVGFGYSNLPIVVHAKNNKIDP